MLSSGLVRAGFVRGRSRGGEMIQRKIHFKTVEKCREKFKAVEKVKNPTVGDDLEGIWEWFFSASLEKLLRCERSWNGQMGLGSSGMAPAGGGGGKRRGSCSGMGLCSGCCAGCVWQLRSSGRCCSPSLSHGSGMSRSPRAGAHGTAAPAQSWGYPQGFHCSRADKSTQTVPLQVPG